MLLTKMQIHRPRHGGILSPTVGADQLSTAVSKESLLGVTQNLQTFEVVEEFWIALDLMEARFSFERRD